MENREQKLINICFQLVMTAHLTPDWWKKATRGEKMKWVAEQLRACGFDTHPVGSSWGVLTSPELREKLGPPEDIDYLNF